MNDTDEGPRLIIASPGNGTRYVVMVTPLSAWAVAELGAQEGSSLVSIWPGQRTSACAVFAPGGYLSAGYVAEKLRVASDEDAAQLARIIGDALGREWG